MIDGSEEQVWIEDDCVDAGGMLNASKLKSLFERLVRHAVVEQGYGEYAIIGNSKGGGLKCTNTCEFWRTGEERGVPKISPYL